MSPSAATAPSSPPASASSTASASTASASTGAILLFDGECGFCQKSVQRVLELDRAERRRGPAMRFAPLQGPTAGAILARHGLTPDAARGFDTMIIVDDPGGPRERLSLFSDAVLSVARYLGGPWAWLGLIGGLVPRPLRDAAYRLVARNRLRLGGKADACRVLKKDERPRFLA